MAVTNTPNQMRYTGSGYLDKKHGSVYPDLESLKKIPFLDKFQGLTVIVLDDGSGDGPCEYWIPGTDRKFVKKGTKVSLKTGEGLNMVDDTISVDSNWLDGKIDEKTASLSERINSIAGNVTKNTEDIQTLSDRISAISGGSKPDGRTIVLKGEQGAEKLAVNVFKGEPGDDVNFLKETEKGLRVLVPLSGDDTNTEIY